MARRKPTVTQTEMKRLIKAALAAGIPADRLCGVQITSAGATLLFGSGSQSPDPSNPFDEVLK